MEHLDPHHDYTKVQLARSQKKSNSRRVWCGEAFSKHGCLLFTECDLMNDFMQTAVLETSVVSPDGSGIRNMRYRGWHG
jgi:hypothetical protein